MRLHVASDLHLHNDRGLQPDSRLLPVKADLLVLAGDIDYVEKVSSRYGNWPYDVVYVRGNHDLYFRPYERSISKAAEHMGAGRVRMLERRQICFESVRLLGCCLWTDFELVGDVDDVMLLNQELGPDYRCLRRTDGRLLTCQDTRAEHRTSVQWLARTLREPFDGATVVISHHAPHRRSVNPEYGVSWSSAAFASDLSHLLRRVKLWIHGHTHVFADYKERGCRVLCNAAGSVQRPNSSFVPDLVVEV
ncbi:metallophosphoesterase [Burkholderia sp. THE68]|uniref:metallophosphoesterase n=1 Tax=Burkholderia sp. THE68 TaxID=758782 RepID=UPI00138A23A7|nr:metallophosphoesterase [Burkholderia sp. THE68]